MPGMYVSVCSLFNELKNRDLELGVVEHACHPSNYEAKAGGYCEFKASLDYKVS